MKKLSKKERNEVITGFRRGYWDKIAFFQDENGNQDWNAFSSGTAVDHDPTYVGGWDSAHGIGSRAQCHEWMNEFLGPAEA